MFGVMPIPLSGQNAFAIVSPNKLFVSLFSSEMLTDVAACMTKKKFVFAL